MEYEESGVTETISQGVDWFWSPDEASTKASTTFSSVGPITWGTTRKWKVDMRWALLRTMVLRLHGRPDVPGPGIPTSWIRPGLRKTPLTLFDLLLHREPSQTIWAGPGGTKTVQRGKTEFKPNGDGHSLVLLCGSDATLVVWLREMWGKCVSHS